MDAVSSRSGWATEFRAQLRLALPLAAVYAGQQAMGAVDTAIVGRTTALELGAVGLGNTLWGFLFMVTMGVMLGLDPLITQALGARAFARARAVALKGIYLAVGCTVVASVGAVLAPGLLAPLGVDPQMARHTTVYLWIRTLSFLPSILMVLARSWLQAHGRTSPLVWATVGGNVLNAPLTWLLVHGGQGWPGLEGVTPMGVAGAAWATVACTVFQLLWVLPGVRDAGSQDDVPGVPAVASLGTALRLGLPLGLQMAAEVGLFALVGLLAARLGTAAMAAHQVALTVASLSFCVSLGIGSAGCVRVGAAVGAADHDGMVRGGGAALLLGVGWMSLTAAVLALAAGPVAAVFSSDPSVGLAAIPLLRVAAVFQLSDGAQAVAAGVLRGAADTHYTSVANVVGHYGVGLPVALGLAFPGGLGVMGLWWGLCAGLSVVAVALVGRFIHFTRVGVARVQEG